MAQQQIQSLLLNYRDIFFLCKFLGIYPHDLEIFQRHNTLQKSKIGPFFVLFSMVVIIVFYNLLIFSTRDEDSSLKLKQNTLTFVIGIFLTYIGLAMMITDQLTAIRNQSKLGELFERIHAVDERLYKERIIVDNSRISFRIRVMIALTVVCELTIMISTYVFLMDYSKWASLLWIASCLPTFYNSLDKIWFAVTLYALRRRFEAINIALEEMVEIHKKFKSWTPNNATNTTDDSPRLEESQYEANLGYFFKELGGIEKGSLKGSGKNKISPIAHSLNSFGEDIGTPQKQHNRNKNMINMAYESELNDIRKIEERFNNFCQLHDEICEIGKTLNELWSYPILVLMAYGFLIFTAQLYFLYCATQDQDIPSLFRSAKNPFITVIALSYTAGKCVYMIYLSWKTSLESKRTGICLHKCGVVVDNNQLYEIVNHLSLKLLNHSVDFSACGFFSLDMETLYGVSGGITSYLIILIQFNLAAQQAKDANRAFSNFNETANLVAGAGVANSTDLYGTTMTTMLTTMADY